jgi:hypothetical protein
LAAVVALIVGRPSGSQAAQASEPAGPSPVGLAVHPELGFLLPSPDENSGKPNSTPGIASVGLGVGYDVLPNVEVEATVAITASSSRATKGANGTVDDGTIIRAVVHWHREQPGLGPLLGAGPAMITGGNFGTVPLLHVEGGLEARSRGGGYFAAAFQLVEPLDTSRPDIDPTQCVTSDCPSRFNPHNPIAGMRVALGFWF